MGVLWSEYVRSEMSRMARSRSFSSSTEALDSDHARYIASRIAQHAQSLATGTRSLPSDSPDPYFQPHERGQTSKGMSGDMGLPVGPPHAVQSLQGSARQANLDILLYLPPSVPEYNERGTDQDGLSTYTSLDDYEAMFEARHGRGAINNNFIATGGMLSTTFPITVPTQAESLSIRATNKDPMTTQISEHIPSGVQSLCSQADQTPAGEEYQPPVKEDVVPPVGVGHILGEGAAVFTDMIETMLTALDKQMAQPDTVQRSVSSPANNLHGPDPMLTQSESRHGTPVARAAQPIKSPIPAQEHEYQPIPPAIGEHMYPDLYLPVTEIIG